MSGLRRLFLTLFLMAPGLISGVFAQNLEGGLHVGVTDMGGELLNERETGGEFGTWVLLWPTDSIAIAADWGRAHRDDWTGTLADKPVAEYGRNRQFFDITLQYHFLKRKKFSLFGEVGGGSHWNNRHVDNPFGLPIFEESGKESTRQRVVTFGGGIRYRLVRHLNWTSAIKVHNPLDDERNSIRLMTGITISFR